LFSRRKTAADKEDGRTGREDGMIMGVYNNKVSQRERGG
jgi:hypothetical protein